MRRFEQGVSQATKNKNSEDKNQDRSDEGTEEDRTPQEKTEKPATTRVIDDDQDVDPTEENVERYLKRFENSLKKHTADKVVSMKGKTVLETTANKLQKQYEILEDMFSGTVITSEVEEKFQERYDTAETNYAAIMSVIDLDRK